MPRGQKHRDFRPFLAIFCPRGMKKVILKNFGSKNQKSGPVTFFPIKFP